MDNTALNAALAGSGSVLPVFIADPAQIEPHTYQSLTAFNFMCESLRELDQSLLEKGSALSIVAGKPADAVRKMIREEKADAVFVNRDYTPFSRKRDESIREVCQEMGAEFVSCGDILINEPELIVKKDGSPYRKFTPYYNAARLYRPSKPDFTVYSNYSRNRLVNSIDIHQFMQSTGLKLPEIGQTGGRKAALGILSNLSGLITYEKLHDIPSVNGTSRLSPHLKFGTVSVREVLLQISTQLGESHPLTRQLYWRDFFSAVVHHFPTVFGQSFQKKYDSLQWEQNSSLFQAWLNGMTGFPIIDAGMRELKKTGFMHNRVRMICASFLTKDLFVDWREGEKAFAQMLTDYDPCLNNGNWQWAASTGCDAQPYFRIFNPWTGQKKYDPDCLYIKRWVAELAEETPKAIHNREFAEVSMANGYPPPIINHSIAAKRALDRYRFIV